MATLKYKFSIGDKVKFIEPADWRELSWCASGFDPERVYEVVGFGWTEKEPGKFEQYYRLLDEEREYLKYDNRILEEYLEGVGEVRPHDLEATLKTPQGEALHVGEKVYWDIIHWGEHYYNPRFSFAGYGPIKALMYYESSLRKYDTCDQEVQVEREFLCDREGRDWLDARKYGNISNEGISSITKTIPEDFAEQYIDAYFKENSTYLEPGDYEYEPVTRWLKHIGVLDKVMELYNTHEPIQKKEREKEAEKKDNQTKKLQKLLSGLSEEEKEQLKKMIEDGTQN